MSRRGACPFHGRHGATPSPLTSCATRPPFTRAFPLKARYHGQVAQIRRLIDTGSITVNVIQGVDGKLAVWHTYGALGKVLRDAGFRFPARVDAIAEGAYEEFGAEILPELDADFIFATYRADTLETPANAVAISKLCCPIIAASRMPGARTSSSLPREEASASSFYDLGVLSYMIISQISGRDFVPMPR